MRIRTAGEHLGEGELDIVVPRRNLTMVATSVLMLAFVAAASADEFTNQQFVVPNVPGHIAPIRELAFSHDSTRLYSAGDDKAIIAWERSNDSPQSNMTWRYSRHIRWEADWGQMGSLNALACSPKSESIVFGGYGYRSHFATFSLADGLAGEILQTINEPHSSRIASLRYSSNGNAIVSADMRGMVILWSDDLKRSRIVRPAMSVSVPTAFFPIALLGADRVVAPEWDVATKSWFLVEQSLRVNAGVAAPLDDTRFRDGVAALAANATGELIAAVGLNEQAVTIWRRVDGQWRKSLVRIPQGSQPRSPLSLSFFPDDRTLAIGTTASKDSGSAVICWDVVEGRECDVRREAGKSHVFACATSPDGEWLAYAGGTGNDIHIEGRGARAGVSQRLVGGAPILSVSFDGASPPYGIRLTQARSGSTESIVFDPATLKLEKSDGSHRSRSHAQWSLRRSPKSAGEYVVLEGMRPRGTINLTPFQCRYVSHQWIARGDATPTAVAISADRENRILVFQLANQGLDHCPLVMQFAGHFSKVSALAQSDDGRRLLSGGADGMASYWDLIPLADESPIFRRWGMRLSDQEGKVVVTRIHASTAAYYRGLREGDEITRIKWSTGGSVTELEGPGKIVAGLNEVPLTAPVHFTTRRGVNSGPTLQVESVWLPLLTVFPWGDEWIGWTPSGYYAASLGGEKAIGWQINHDLRTPPDFFSASRFRKSLFRPDLLPRYLNTAELNPEDARPSMTQRLPPRIEGIVFEPAQKVDSQRRHVRIEGSSFSMVARLSPLSREPTTQLQLSLNRGPWRRENKKVLMEGEFAQEWRISLTPGRHTLQVFAKNEFGDSESEPWTVDVDYDPQRVTERLYVLAIGAVHPVQQGPSYVVNDATSISRTFQDPRRTRAVYESVRIQELLGDNATRDKIREGFSWLRQQMREGSNDVGLLYYCGGGFLDHTSQRNYLLPSDGNRSRVETCVSEDEIRRLCQDVGGRGRMIVALDANHAGEFDPERLARDFASDDYNVIAMVSSSRGMRSLEHPTFNAGVFTKVLKDGLESRSDRDSNGRVSHVELAQYLRSEIRRLTAERQVPIIVLPWETPRLELTSVVAPANTPAN